MLQINRTILTGCCSSGVSAPTALGWKYPQLRHQAEHSPDYTATLTPNPERIASLSPALDRPGQRGEDPALGKRRRITLNSIETGCRKSPATLAHATARARTSERSDTSSSTWIEGNRPSGPWGVMSVNGDS